MCVNTVSSLTLTKGDFMSNKYEIITQIKMYVVVVKILLNILKYCVYLCSIMRFFVLEYFHFFNILL